MFFTKLLKVNLTRDSVCAGDDFDAPHEKTVEVNASAEPINPIVLARTLSSDYLPIVFGIGHTWICVLNNNKIAVMTTTGIQPLLKEVQLKDHNHVHFIYKSANE